MRSFLTAVALLVFVPFSNAQENTPYGVATLKAIAEGKPLVVFVGIEDRPIEGVLTIQVKTLRGYDNGVVVISTPRVVEGETSLYWFATMKGDTTNDDILGKLYPPTQPILVSADVVESLDEVNAARARSGLRPLIRDDGLTIAAATAAKFRADRLISGHIPQQYGSDFSCLPPGARSNTAGCGATSLGWGWRTCCTYEQWTYAGAAYVMGRDGRRYMHLFVR